MVFRDTLVKPLSFQLSSRSLVDQMRLSDSTLLFPELFATAEKEVPVTACLSLKGGITSLYRQSNNPRTNLVHPNTLTVKIKTSNIETT